MADEAETPNPGASDALFSREEVLGGLPARRARTLLFLVESRTAHLLARSRQAMAPFVTERAERERDLAFLEAFALGRDPPLRPTIQDLERQSAHWAPLVPANPQLRAALAHLLGEKYAFTERSAPGIRASLELDGEPVQRAYQRLYRRPLEAIYAPRVGAAERLRWAGAGLAARLESLPPFWTAYALTLTETVGAGVLALPIAVAGIGPLPAVAFLLVLGILSLLTMACMSEAVARSGPVRYGNAFYGRLVGDYLGGLGSLLTTVMLGIRSLVVLTAYYYGVSTTLAGATGLPAELWIPLLFLVGLYLLSRRSLNATVASALVVGAINFSLLLIISLLAFTHVRWENLSYEDLPFLGGHPFEPAILQLIFGVILSAYFGHVSLSNCARVVLRRDPSARSLVRGTLAAQATALLIYCTWVLAVDGAVEHGVLMGQKGTALIPLAAEVGPGVGLLGVAYVLLGMGMASVHASFALFNLVRERLPGRSQATLLLPRGRGRLLLRPGVGQAGGVCLGLSYLGLADGQPRLRFDVQVGETTRRVETAVAGRWEVGQLCRQLSGLEATDLPLTLEVLDAGDEHLRLRATTTMSLVYEGDWHEAGLRMLDVLSLPDAERQLVSWITRRGEVALAEVAARLGRDEQGAATALSALIAGGAVREDRAGGEARYRAGLARKRGGRLPGHIWQALQGRDEQPAAGPARQSPRGRLRWRLAGGLVQSERGRFCLSVAPVVVVSGLTEWLLLADAASFAGPLGWNGVIAVSLFAGLFPTLLLASSRRKGQFVPGTVFGFLGHPLLVVSIYSLFLANVFLHGLVIWQQPVERVSTVLLGVLMLAASVEMIRRGALARRVVVELRQDQDGGRACFSILSAATPSPAEVWLRYPEGERRLHEASGEVPSFSTLRSASFELPSDGARELKVWAHRVTPEGDSESLPAVLEVSYGAGTRRFDLALSGGQALLPLGGDDCRLTITFPEPSAGREESQA